MGALDGITILRYGHVYDSGGGIERYLADLNRTLHGRSDFTTIQIQLTSDSNRVGESDEGPVKRLSLFVSRKSHEEAVSGTPRETALARIKSWGWDYFLSSRWIYPIFTRPVLAVRSIERRAGEPDGAGAAVLRMHRRHPLNLICLHSAGGADVSEILAVARAERIPAVYVHHFSNDRLSSFSIRSQLLHVREVAGVCSVDVPRYVRGRMRSVLDGVDTDFFSRSAVFSPAAPSADPIILLPARMTPAKGQAELLRAAGGLKRQGLRFSIVLAGRTDSSDYLAALDRIIVEEDLGGWVSIVGELPPEALREMYTKASMVALPTRHHEGLPRILLECQSMETPPVVFDIGGTREGVKDAETGFLVKPGNQAAFADKLRMLLTDAGLRQRMGRAGRRWIEDRFSLQALADRHEQLYARVLLGVSDSRS
jgi:glycosyltransferase involved in cell wall biosynthesis